MSLAGGCYDENVVRASNLPVDLPRWRHAQECPRAIELAMSVLVVQIPPRRRQGPQDLPGPDSTAPPGTDNASAGAELLWVRTQNGVALQAQGQSAAALLPAAEVVVAVLSELDASWQRVTLPKAPSAKLRSAVLGMIEEQLLAETDQVHVALEPDATPGAPCWVAVVDKAWLQSQLAAIERGGSMVDRVVPAAWPGQAAHGHFFDAALPGQTPDPAVAVADMNGVLCLPLAGTLARSTVSAAAAATLHWSAPPALVAAAERWLGAPVAAQTQAQRLLLAARSTWNLRQFDLAPRRQGTVALRDAWRRFVGPAWRPVRIGLLALAVVQVVGLNAWAWSQRQALAAKRQAQAALLTDTHPQVRGVQDAPLQMERETDLLRVAAGQPGASDLESMLAAVSAAWPDNQGPLQGLRFQLGQLTLVTAGWSADDVRQFSERLRPTGWAVDPQPGRLVVTRPSPSAARGDSTAAKTSAARSEGNRS